MKRAALAVLLAGAVAGVLAGRAGTQSGEPLLAAVGEGSTARLTAVDPLTLAPVGRSTQIGYYQWPWALSPDATRIVLARQRPASLRFVDLRRMRTLRAVGLWRLASSSVDAVDWVSPRLLLAVVDTTWVVAVDPVRGRIRWRVALPDQAEAVERAANGFVFLIAPSDQVGSTTLVTVDATRAVRSVRLDRVLSGVHQDEQDQTRFTIRRPGLAVDRVADRAFVVGAGEPVAEVDLATLAVSYHGGSRALAKAVDGPERSAAWLGNGLIAVTGSDAHTTETTKEGQSSEHVWWTPAGLTLVDTRDWTARLIDPGADAVSVADGLLLASAWTYDSAATAPSGIGVAAYGLDGSPRFHVLSGPVGGVQAGAGMAYASTPLNPADEQSGAQISVIDLSSGRVVNTLPNRAVLLLTQ